MSLMSVDLEKALSAIQRGADEQLEVLKSQKKEKEQGGVISGIKGDRSY